MIREDGHDGREPENGSQAYVRAVRRVLMDGLEHDEAERSGVGDLGGLQFDAEPSLGSLDRMANQEHAYEQCGDWIPQDGEQDPGHRPPTEAQRTRWRERKSPAVVTINGKRVRVVTAY